MSISVCGHSCFWSFWFVQFFGLWLFWSVAVSVCGRFGLWPFRSVAFLVCGRFSSLWPFRFVAVMTRILSYNMVTYSDKSSQIQQHTPMGNSKKTLPSHFPNYMSCYVVFFKSVQRLLPINSLWPSDAIWWSGSTLTLVTAWCLMAPSHYLNPCWLCKFRGIHQREFRGIHQRGISQLQE